MLADPDEIRIFRKDRDRSLTPVADLDLETVDVLCALRPGVRAQARSSTITSSALIDAWLRDFMLPLEIANAARAPTSWRAIGLADVLGGRRHDEEVPLAILPLR